MLGIRGPTEHAECFNGYVLRIAGANGLASGELLRLAALPAYFAFRICDTAALSRLTGESEARLHFAAHWPCTEHSFCSRFLDTCVPNAFMLQTRARICPLCLRESEVIPALWNIGLYAACHRHRVKMIEQCHHCDRRLSHARPDAVTCKCGKTLLDAPRDKASGDVSQLCGLIARGDDCGEAPWTTRSNLLRMIRFFGLDHSDRGWRSAFMAKPGVEAGLDMLRTSAGVILGWPRGLNVWVEQQRRHGGSGTALGSRFTPAFARIQPAFPGQLATAILDQVRQYLALQWDAALLHPRSFCFAGHGPRSYVCGGAAADALGINRGTLVRDVTRGVITGAVVVAGSRSKVIVDPEAMVARRRAIEGMRTEAGAAVTLGVGQRWVGRFRRDGLLVPSLRRNRQWLYADNDIAMFLAKLSNQCVSGQRSRDMVSLAAVPNLRRQGLLTIISEIMDGSLSSYITGGVPASLREIYIDRAAASCSPSGLTVRQAAYRLHLSTRMVPHLVKAGCLTKCGGRILKASVDSFAGAFVLARELATEWNTSTRRVAALLKHDQIEPVVVSNSAVGISAVWRRADVAFVSEAALGATKAAA